MRLGVVYKVSIGGNYIVGSTINWKRRKNHYKNQLKNNKYNNQLAQNSYNKYGKDSLKFEILQKDIPENILQNIEDIWIGSLCSRIEDKKGGMNMRDGFRVRHSKETILKMSKPIVQRDKNGVFIKKWDSINQVYRENPNFKGRNITAVIQNKRRTAYGFQWHEESKDNSLPIKPSKQCFKVLQMDMDGNPIKEWNSTNETRLEGFVQSKVVLCCNGIFKQHKGFKWKYL